MTSPFHILWWLPVFRTSKLRSSRRKRSGFTLIETALALGIVAFALVPLIGLLPVGLQVSKNASDLTIAAQIAQRLAGIIQQSDFSNYPSFQKKYFAFDNEGQPVAQQSNTQTQLGSGAAVYSAGILSVKTAAPASLADGAGAVTLLIQIVNDPGQLLKSNTPDVNLPKEIRSKPILIPVYLANNGS